MMLQKNGILARIIDAEKRRRLSTAGRKVPSPVNSATTSTNGSNSLAQRVAQDPASLSTNDVLNLQRAVGNQAMVQLLRGPGAVGAIDDKAEQEAEQVADRALLSQPTRIARKPAASVDSGLGNSGGPIGKDGGVVSDEVSQEIQRSRGTGSFLPDRVRDPVEKATGHDFRHVRVHHDNRGNQLSRALNAPRVYDR